MDRFAQTHLQLYRQLSDASYSEEDILLIDRAYQIAMVIFAGNYRPNNKPFLMHLVGVASILVMARQPASVITAGLLHSAYPLGLGRSGNRIKPVYRNEFAEKLGRDVEELIYEYANHHWSMEYISSLADNLESLTIENTQLYLIKLADIHEEFLDAGHAYQPRKILLPDEGRDDAWLQQIAHQLTILGHEKWAREFQNAVEENNILNPPAPLCGTAPSSYILAPGWSKSRLKNKLIKWLSRH